MTIRRISAIILIMSQEVFIYLDDSGTLHDRSEGQYFVYAGYFFLSKKEKDAALAKYRSAVKKVNPDTDKELKAFGTLGKTKRFLNSALKDCESFSCVVDKKEYTHLLWLQKSRSIDTKITVLRELPKQKLST